MSSQTPLKLRFARLLTLSVLLWAGASSTALGGCTGDGMLGITQKDPIMSSVDVTFAPTYSVSSTSGTSGCKNWDFAHLLQEERLDFLTRNGATLLEETTQGAGPAWGAFSSLAGCLLDQASIHQVMHQHQDQLFLRLERHDPELWVDWKQWVYAAGHPSGTCQEVAG
jgi:hypothetical protein